MNSQENRRAWSVFNLAAVQVASFRAWPLLAIPLFALVIVGLAALGILAPAIYSVSRTIKEPTTPSRPNTPRKEKVLTASRVRCSRLAAKNRSGNVSTRAVLLSTARDESTSENTRAGEQVFDSGGKFITQEHRRSKNTPARACRGSKGHGLRRAGRPHRKVIGGETGEKLGELEYERSGFDDVTAGADGGLVTARQSNRTTSSRSMQTASSSERFPLQLAARAATRN